MERDVFLSRIAARQAPPSSTGAHPAPAPRPFQVLHRRLDAVDGTDPDAMLPVFLSSAERAGTHARAVRTADVPEAVHEIVREHGIRTAVLTAEPEAQELRVTLEAVGVEVVDHELTAASEADLGVTSAVAGVAATGSVVVSSATASGRGAAVLPLVHLCLLPIERLRPAMLDSLREVTSAGLPSNLTFITGPSRTGDIELILTVGVHGPVAVHVLVVR